jgi:hypothetical protein
MNESKISGGNDSSFLKTLAKYIETQLEELYSLRADISNG